ncbi:hypothetical protein [Streptomyces sp. NPDC021356]|uniref:hypothetical protein n=1 Tax=Streptomyces sp. NPDC021356 TaxID=3154900 RepID=UPI0033F5D616
MRHCAAGYARPTSRQAAITAAASSAIRVFLPGLCTGMGRLLRAGARVGVAELLHTRQSRLAAGESSTTVAARDTEA